MLFYVVCADLWGHLDHLHVVSAYPWGNMYEFLRGICIPVPGTSWVPPGCSWVHSGCRPVVLILTFPVGRNAIRASNVWGGTLERVPPCLLGVSRASPGCYFYGDLPCILVTRLQNTFYVPNEMRLVECM